jgi:ribosomal protein L39E
MKNCVSQKWHTPVTKGYGFLQGKQRLMQTSARNNNVPVRIFKSFHIKISYEALKERRMWTSNGAFIQAEA